MYIDSVLHMCACDANLCVLGHGMNRHIYIHVILSSLDVHGDLPGEIKIYVLSISHSSNTTVNSSNFGIQQSKYRVT